MAPEVYRPGLFDTFLLDHDNVCHGNLVWVFHRNDHPNGEKYVIEAALTLL